MSLTYCKILQALVDEIDEKTDASIFGEVTCEGGHAYVVVDADYFIRINEKSRMHLLTGISDQWREKCNGTAVTFKTLKGAIVAEM